MTDSEKECVNDTLAMEARYERAQTLMQGIWNQQLVQNDILFPHWIKGEDCFWYIRAYKIGKDSAIKIGKEYRLVDAINATNKTAFDHEILARELSAATGQTLKAQDLPIQRVSIQLSPLKVVFTAFDKNWIFDTTDNSCIESTLHAIKDEWKVSPDGRFAVFERDYNIWVRELSSGEERALTQDGEEYYVYGAVSTAWGYPCADELHAKCSYYATKIFTLQRDTRQVKANPVVHHLPRDGSLRPTVEYIKVAYPEDEHVEEQRLVAIEIATGKICEANYRRVPTCSQAWGFFNMNLGWWHNNSKLAYFIDQDRDYRRIRLVEFNTVSGATRILFEEFSETQINLSLYYDDYPAHRYLPETNELIWCSERSGWFHLYLYDLDQGELKNVVTQGQWRIRDVLHYDAETRELTIQTAGRVPDRDPYYCDISRVNIDTGTITTVCTSDDEYTVVTQSNSYGIYAELHGWNAGKPTNGVAPSGNFLVTTRSRADRVPTSLLVNRVGKMVLELETADIFGLPDGWHWPEPFEFTAADGKTELYGLMFRPSDFSADKCYPVINFMSSCPIVPVVLKGSFGNGKPYAGWFYLQMAALAELGFMVVAIDSRGTPLRSKTFLDHSYGWMASACDIEDHLAGIRYLASEYSFLDLTRVGIYGPGGYQGAIDNLMRRSDFYSVGVVHLLQDTRLMPSTLLGDMCEGREGRSDDMLHPEELTKSFRGKLFLTHAMLDPEHLVTNTFRLVEALQRENKDFDLLVMPTIAHGFSGYQIRRSWDYFVKNLMGAKPPKQFKLTTVFDS